MNEKPMTRKEQKEVLLLAYQKAKEVFDKLSKGGAVDMENPEDAKMLSEVFSVLIRETKRL